MAEGINPIFLLDFTNKPHAVYILYTKKKKKNKKMKPGIGFTFKDSVYFLRRN